MRCLPRYHILANLAESENKYRKFACENCHFTAVRFALLLHDLHVNVESTTFKHDYLQKTWKTVFFFHLNKAATGKLVKLSTLVVIDYYWTTSTVS